MTAVFAIAAFGFAAPVAAGAATAPQPADGSLGMDALNIDVGQQHSRVGEPERFEPRVPHHRGGLGFE